MTSGKRASPLERRRRARLQAQDPYDRLKALLRTPPPVPECVVRDIRALARALATRERRRHAALLAAQVTPNARR